MVLSVEQQIVHSVFGTHLFSHHYKTFQQPVTMTCRRKQQYLHKISKIFFCMHPSGKFRLEHHLNSLYVMPFLSFHLMADSAQDSEKVHDLGTCADHYARHYVTSQHQKTH